MLPQFENTPLWVDGLALLIAAVTVWVAGVRLARGADQIAERTGLRQAVLGVLLLAVATSLPEVAVTTTAALSGNAALAVNNLLGGLALQVTVLALADAVLGRDALTAVVADPGVLLQGLLCAALLVLVVAGIALGDPPLLGVGMWGWGIVGGYLASLWLVTRKPAARTRWVVDGKAEAKEKAKETEGAAPQRSRRTAERSASAPDAADASLAAIVGRTGLAALAILAAGVILARAGEGIAAKTDLGMSFVGAVLVAGSTSLPEVSTVFGAVRLRRYEMAVADIFGTNLADVALVPLVDALSSGPPVLGEMGRFSTAAALLAMTLTLIYLAGLIERGDRTVLRMGIDSLLVLLVYAGGVALLYRLR